MKEKFNPIIEPPRDFPNCWGHSEYPLHFEFYNYDIDIENLQPGEIVGEQKTHGPEQFLLWDGEGIVTFSKKRYIEKYGKRNT